MLPIRNSSDYARKNVGISCREERRALDSVPGRAREIVIVGRWAGWPQPQSVAPDKRMGNDRNLSRLAVH